MAAVDPAAWLRTTPPFDGLPEPLFARAARGLEVRFFPAGARLARVGGPPLEHLHVIRKGVVRLERDGRSVQELEEGEVVGVTSLLTGRAQLDVVVEEDAVVYLVPGDAFRALMGHAPFARHFALSVGERLKGSLDRSPIDTFAPDLSLEVQQLVRDPVAWVDAGATVADAARAMREARTSAALLRGEPPAILTDRDLRNRVLAAGLGADAPAEAVASRPVRTVPWGSPVHVAWAALLDAGVHHLPVVRGAEVVGVLTTADLLRCTTKGPLEVLRRVERLGSRAQLPGHAAEVAQMVGTLLASGLDPVVVAGFVARVHDALTHRVLRWAEADLGGAPVPYAWLALGSEGRMEQTLVTDQDNALCFDDAGAPHRAWFQRLAERVNGDLEAAGVPPCPGGTMASRWLGTTSEWRERLAGWMDSTAPAEALEAAIFFDLRRAAGGLDPAPLEAVVLLAAERPAFLRFLVRGAVGFRPPPPLLLSLRGGTAVDLKRHGLAPVALLARAYGLAAGVRGRGTLERLDGAVRRGLLGEETGALVAEAFRFLLGLRLERQLADQAAGRDPAAEVPLSDLSALTRARLKDAFRAVRAFQEKAAAHFGTEL